MKTDWSRYTNPGECTFCHRCGWYMVLDKICEHCSNRNLEKAELIHSILFEVTQNISDIRAKYLNRTFWMEKL